MSNVKKSINRVEINDQFVKHIIPLLLVLISNGLFAQERFNVVFQNEDYSRYFLATENDSVVKALDSTYVLAYNTDSFDYFHIFAISGEDGWCAVDINETILFKVYNVEHGTPSPDDLINGFIRIVDNGLIGFANEFGEIVIEPQFEIASSFENGYAVIGKSCNKIPWGEHHDDGGCEHYSVKCEQHGYIDSDGTIIEFGDFSYDQITEKIGDRISRTK